MDWIDKLNKELEERRDYNKSSKGKEEANQRMRSWVGKQGGSSKSPLVTESRSKTLKKLWQENREKLIEISRDAGIKGGNTYSELRNKKASETGKKTWKENFKDVVEKRRSYKGEGNVRCTITEETAINILTDYVNEPKKYGLFIILAEKYNCSKRVVQKICRRETWKHIQPKK